MDQGTIDQLLAERKRQVKKIARQEIVKLINVAKEDILVSDKLHGDLVDVDFIELVDDKIMIHINYKPKPNGLSQALLNIMKPTKN